MNTGMKYRGIFPQKNVLLAVIHVISQEQAFANVKIAAEGGADGVFLISHDSEKVSWGALLKIYWEVVRHYPKLWVGLNFLDLSTCDAIEKTPAKVGGLWVDNMEIQTTTPAELSNTCKADANFKHWHRKMNGKRGLFFGSVAFKYQKAVADVGLAARVAIDYTDVIVTSGVATGHSPDISKIVTMRRAIGNHFPLAVASGITPENVGQYCNHVDCFLVATGISKDFNNLDPSRLGWLVEEIKRAGKRRN